MENTKTHLYPYPARKLYVALELASNSWKVALSDAPARRPRVVTLLPYAENGLFEELDRARARFGLAADCDVMVVMEAGRDGFGPHRWLEALGLPSIVIDPASVDVNRRKRRAKTDRLDALALLSRLIQHDWGVQGVWQVCRIPSEEAEDRRHLTREREALVGERTRHVNRIKGLLATQGIKTKLGCSFADELDEMRDPRGQPLRTCLRERLLREYRRLELVREQIRELDAVLRTRATTQHDMAEAPEDAKVWLLHQIRGVGPITANTLVDEFYGWREFNNRKEVGGASGLTGTPYDTGNDERDQGISKAANARIRRIAIEMAWAWVRFQPESALVLWFEENFRGVKRRARIGIVALARRILIALWHFVEHGVVLDGVKFKKQSPLLAA